MRFLKIYLELRQYKDKSDQFERIPRLTLHDEVEPNLKKTHLRNGIWGLEAIVM